MRKKTQIHSAWTSVTPRQMATILVMALVTQPRIKQFISRPR